MGRLNILDDPQSPDRPGYPRRFPRMGSQFQARINKTAESFTRPPPDLMSSQYPHVPETKVEREEGLKRDTPLCQDSTGRSNRLPVQRGGLLLHTPSQDKVHFAQFVHPLMVSVGDVRPESLTNDAWKQHIVEVGNKGSPKKRRRAQRGGVKRGSASSDDDELVGSLEGMLKKQDRKESWNKLQVGEDDACALEYLQLQHSGNVEAAELKVLVNMTAGQASKHVKCIESNQAKKRKLPPVCSSESWRAIYERKEFVSVLGRLQDTHLIPYAIKQPLQSGLAFDDSIGLSYDRDDMKGAWRSVLAWGKSIEQQLDACTTKTKKLPFSAVVSFISNAYRLPTPETCFGTHHVMIEEVSNCLLAILGHIAKAREAQAEIRDKMYNESKTGIDADALQKYVETRCRPLSVGLDELEMVCRFKEIISEWEGRLPSTLETRDIDDVCEEHDDLAIAERMSIEAKSHGYVSKGLVQLNFRIRKARELRDRILRWTASCAHGNKEGAPRTVAALAKDARRLKFVFPEVRELLEFHRKVELWIDRANIAIRSRISLAEVRALIRQGEELPLDMSDHLEKLKTRAHTADRWLRRLEEVVKCPKTDTGEADMLRWTKHMRLALHGGHHSFLHELGSDGSRIPVDVDAVKLLQVELDAKSWSLKAQKWLPGNEESKKGKLGDIREHVDRARNLRERLALSATPKQQWVLDGEEELVSIVSAADAWFDKYKQYLEGDNRRNQCRSRLSLAKLRAIVEAERSIFANIGNAACKISRILAQAEVWYEQHHSLLIRCNLESSGSKTGKSHVELAEMEKAVESAAADISLDLDEAVRLKDLVDEIRQWFNRVAIVAPQRSKRQNRTSRSSFTIDDLLELIEESSSFPVDVTGDLKRLQIQLSVIQTWRLHASHELQRIGSGFAELRESMTSAYGLPSEFRIDRFAKLVGVDDEGNGCEHENRNLSETGSLKDDSETAIGMAASDVLSLDGHQPARLSTEAGRSDVHRMIRDLHDGAKGNGVMTVEAELADLLERVSRWCLRSLKYMGSPREIYDRRFFGAFDRFIGEGNELVANYADQQRKSVGTPYDCLTSNWSEMMADQLERLNVLRSDRAKFIQWCEVANKVLSDEKKLTMEKLKDLAEKSRCFPAASDLIHRVRGLSVKVATWVDEARTLYSSGKKLSMQDAKALLEAGEKLKVNTQELRTLRASLRAARIWTNKVKRCNLEQGEIHVSTVNNLIEEHKSFMIEMPEELSVLEQATQAYCICRRPYEGFMIGCDDCEEWYHGSCIGVSESRADRFDKYSCVRCSTINVFRSSALGAVDIIKKWTSWKHLKKARQVDYQKHQRKVRKETKDIEKFRAILKSSEGSQTMQAGLAASCGNLQIASFDPQGDTSGAGSIATVVDKNASPVPPTTGVPGSPHITEGATEHCPNSAQVVPHNECNEETPDARAKAEAAIHQAEERLQALSLRNTARKQLEKDEDENARKLRRWCIRVRSRVLVPSEKAQCDKACPPLDGTLSTSMSSLLCEAESFEISCLPDFISMSNFFRCMSWSLYTLSIINRKPSFDEMTMVLSQGSSLKLPDEKALKTMKVMHQRAIQWQAKVKKAIMPRAGETKPLNLSLLRELSASVSGIALHIPETSMLDAAINDRGARHCICGGPSNGSVMLNCVKCKKKFHRICVNDPNGLNPESWVCVPCSGRTPSPLLDEKNDSDRREAEIMDSLNKRGVSPHAPDPLQLWPPFPLFGSPESLKLLGPECSLIPDDTGIMEFHDQTMEKLSSTASKVEKSEEKLKSILAEKELPQRNTEMSQTCTMNEASVNLSDITLCSSSDPKQELVHNGVPQGTALAPVVLSSRCMEGGNREGEFELGSRDNGLLVGNTASSEQAVEPDNTAGDLADTTGCETKAKSPRRGEIRCQVEGSTDFSSGQETHKMGVGGIAKAGLISDVNRNERECLEKSVQAQIEQTTAEDSANPDTAVLRNIHMQVDAEAYVALTEEYAPTEPTEPGEMELLHHGSCHMGSKNEVGSLEKV